MNKTFFVKFLLLFSFIVIQTHFETLLYAETESEFIDEDLDFDDDFLEESSENDVQNKSVFINNEGVERQALEEQLDEAEKEILETEKIDNSVAQEEGLNTEAIERQLASDELQEPKEFKGILKPSENISNGNDGNKVIVEPRNIIPISSNSNKMEMVPYRARRKNWGVIWGLSYGLFQPNDYVLDQQAVTYEEVDASSIGLISLELAFKYNFSAMSLGLFTSLGYFKSELTNTLTGAVSDLTFIPLKIGAFIELDTLFSEPYIVPYGHAGVYASQYSEESEFTSVDGSSFLAYYMTAGLMFQLDWIDDLAARVAYQDGGIENTFLFAEVNYMSSSLVDIDEAAEKDPDLSSLYYSAGVKLEF